MQVVLNRWSRVLVASTCLLICAAGLRAQSADGGDATVVGTDVDQSGRAIAGASVALTNEATKAVQTVMTGSDGHFAVTNLPGGSYAIEVSKSGFSMSKRAGVHPSDAELSIPLAVAELSQSVTVEAVASLAAQLSPSGNTLDAISAKTEVSPAFIQNFTSPLADFNEVIQMAPGTFSVNSNGVGLGQGKTFFRGFKDGQYTMTYDGIPFQDTNDPTHHSWAFFPGPWIGGVDFDRSPGTASTNGPSNFGGSINLVSRDIQTSHDPDIRASVSYGSFDTRLLDLSMDSGDFGGKGKKSSLFVDVHQLLSDGYQTYNHQKRDAGSLKYQYKVLEKTTITAYFGDIDLWTNTPDTNAPSRAQVAQFGDNFLLNNNPASPFFYRYSYYHIQTDFGYIGVHSDLGHGWTLDNKGSTYRYWNKQNLEKNLTKITSTSAIDKPNGANHICSGSDWKWRRRSPSKVMERTHEEATEALHARREGRHSEAASA